ncbi:MFS transporter [Micromonospora sp. NPDC047740]|uniref:MFS transporter n=1 Tax=Micromonospora sp. NPDC047740 TaxID=3364254 RepID=UPI00370F7BDB
MRAPVGCPPEGAPRVTRPQVRLRFQADGAWVGAANAGFSFALGAASVALPLQAVAAGYGPVEVGVLTAISAISQMTGRMSLGRLMRVMPDWVIIAIACVVLAISSTMVVISSALAPFVIAQLLQGVARAYFWTGSQTHVVRGEGSSVKALASVNLIGNLGLLAGPVIAGLLIGEDAHTALLVAAAAAIVSLIPTARLDRLPPFRKVQNRPPGRLWARAGVWEGCYAGVTAGAWRGLLGSYVPIALVRAGHLSATVGILVAVANATAILGSWLVRHVDGDARARRIMRAGTPVTGAAMAVMGLAAGSSVLAGLALAASGIAAGALQTLGPALASDSVHPEERGEAIAATGVWRAASLFVSPLVTAGLVAVAPIGAAMVVTGALIAAPIGQWVRPRAASS